MSIIDDLVKSRNLPSFVIPVKTGSGSGTGAGIHPTAVIPAKAGIQTYQVFPGFRVKPGMTNIEELRKGLRLLKRFIEVLRKKGIRHHETEESPNSYK